MMPTASLMVKLLSLGEDDQNEVQHYCTYKPKNTSFIFHAITNHICANNKYVQDIPQISDICELVHVHI